MHPFFPPFFYTVALPPSLSPRPAAIPVSTSAKYHEAFRCFLDISADNAALGRVVVELRGDVVDRARRWPSSLMVTSFSFLYFSNMFI